jgi:MFS transporter, PHS family, inorganic phosphate transporter
VVLSVGGFIPGFFAAAFTIDRVGRKPLQIGGFAILVVLFCIIGFAWDELGVKTLFALFCLCNFFSNFGPNTTTFIVPGEHFPTRYRATAHGISAAAGKVGSIVSQVLYNGLKDHGGDPNGWVKNIMRIYALFM